MSLIGQMLQFTYSGPVKGLSIYGTMICIHFKDDVLTNPTGSSTSFLLHHQITIHMSDFSGTDKLNLGIQSFREAIGILSSWVDSTSLNNRTKLCLDLVIQTAFWVLWRYRN